MNPPDLERDPNDLLGLYEDTLDWASHCREMRRAARNVYERLESSIWMRLKRKIRGRKRLVSSDEINMRVQRLRSRSFEGRQTRIGAWWDDWQKWDVKFNHAEGQLRLTFAKAKDREWQYWSAAKGPATVAR